MVCCGEVVRRDIMIAGATLGNEPTYIEIEHTADWAIRVRGATLSELFVNAAAGMYHLMADVSGVTPSIERAIEASGVDPEALLVNWLNELVYHTEMDGVIFCEFHVASLEPTHLQATARGNRGMQLKKQVKAATFHNLQIISTDAGYEATLVFDV